MRIMPEKQLTACNQAQAALLLTVNMLMIVVGLSPRLPALSKRTKQQAFA
jgi:hypothetical protein